MALNKQRPLHLAILEPTANSVTLQNDVVTIFSDTINGYTFSGQSPIRINNNQNVTLCESQCEDVCTSAVWSVTFKDIDFGDFCGGCEKNITLNLNRTLRFSGGYDVGDSINADIPLQYTGPRVGVVSAADIAQNFLLHFTNRFRDGINEFSSLHNATATVSGAVLTITIPCNQLPDEVEGVVGVTGAFLSTEAPTVNYVTQYAPATLTRQRLHSMFPPNAFSNAHTQTGEHPYRVLLNYPNCQAICMLRLEECTPACESEYNTGTAAVAGTKKQYDIFVNASAPGYAAFIAQLRNYIPSCNASTTLANRPTLSGTTIVESKKNTGASGKVSFVSSDYANDIPASYNGGVVVRITSTLPTAINVSLIVSAATARVPSDLAAAFAAVGYTFIASAGSDLQVTTGNNNDDVTLTILYP